MHGGCASTPLHPLASGALPHRNARYNKSLREGGKWCACTGGGGGGVRAPWRRGRGGGGGWERGSRDRLIAELLFGVSFYPILGPRDNRAYIAYLPTCGPPRGQGLCSLTGTNSHRSLRAKLGARAWPRVWFPGALNHDMMETHVRQVLHLFLEDPKRGGGKRKN